MYKKNYALRRFFGSRAVKTLVYMKLVMIFLTVASVQVAAHSYGQNVSIDAKRASFKMILGEIRKQTGKDFIYNSSVINEYKKVNMTVDNMHWSAALEILLDNQGLTYTAKGNTVLLKKASRGEVSPVSSRTLQTGLRGTVSSADGQPVLGATVSLVGSSRSTATDGAGSFSFDNVPASGQLSVQSLGYQSVTVSYQDYLVPEIVLMSMVEAMDEVVVVGYGVQKKSEMIGSVSEVKGDAIAKRSVPQLSQALTGQMPGVTVIQRSGQPGASGGNIQIRGVGSFGAGTGALILVDGIPTNSFNDIDPNDVASISVLKDASSAAIYGARAANGVILVTTKTGATKDKLSIGYSGYAGIQKPTAYPEFVNSWEYATAMNETTGGGGGYSEEEIQKFKDGSDPDNYPNSDFIGGFFKGSAMQTGHNFNLSNNTERMQYSFSLGYLNQKGIVKKNSYDRYNARLNIVSNIRENLKLTTRLSAIQTSDSQPAPPATLDFNDMIGMISNVVRFPSIYPIRLSNGDWGTGNNQKGTPVSFLESDSFFKDRYSNMGGNIRLDWAVIPELTLSAIGGYTQESSRTRRFLASQRLNDRITLGPATLNQTNPYKDYKTLQALAEYNKRFNKHDVKVLVGYSYEEGYDETLTAFRQNFPTNDLTELNVGSPDGQKNSGTASEWGLESLFARLQYNFDRRYLLEGVVRYDGSSRFPTDKKYAVFPSVAAGWLLTEEGFLKGKFEWLNELKLKGSFGVLGNQNIGNYPYQSILNSGYNYPFGGTIAPGVAQKAIVDPNLKWESTRTADVGLEGSFLNRALTFSATYYDRYTYDILVSPGGSVSDVLGFDVGLQNSGKLKNRGWEFTLGYNKRVNDWSYGATFNYATVSNEVIDLGVGNVTQPNGLVGNGSSLFIGYPMQLYYGYKTDGLFVDDADVAAWANMNAVNPNAKPGDIRYVDISGPDGVPDGKVDPVYDRTVLGSQIPKHTYGLNLNISYKNIDFSALLQGVSGVKGQLNGYAGMALHNLGNIQRWQYEGRWTTENPNRNALHPRMEQIPSSGTPNTLSSDFWLLNASYLRLKNIQVGYTLPKGLTNNWKIDGLRIHASAENLFTNDSYRQGWDPEINSGGGYYPIMRTFTFGVNLNF